MVNICACMHIHMCSACAFSACAYSVHVRAEHMHVLHVHMQLHDAAHVLYMYMLRCAASAHRGDEVHMQGGCCASSSCGVCALQCIFAAHADAAVATEQLSTLRCPCSVLQCTAGPVQDT